MQSYLKLSLEQKLPEAQDSGQGLCTVWNFEIVLSCYSHFSKQRWRAAFDLSHRLFSDPSPPAVCVYV